MSTSAGGRGEATLDAALERMRLDGAIAWEEAFSRAFKRDHGAAPGAWRLARRTAP